MAVGSAVVFLEIRSITNFHSRKPLRSRSTKESHEGVLENSILHSKTVQTRAKPV